MKRAFKLGFLTALVIGAVAAPAPAGSSDRAERAGPAIVRVKDDVYSPARLIIGSGRRVEWIWSARNRNDHNVRLRRGPAGVGKARFRSPTGETGIRFTQRFGKPGRYRFICTVHPDTMRMRINVTR